MSNGHGSSRRQAYGRRMKELRTRRSDDLEVDLEGPCGWSRGSAWDSRAAAAPCSSERRRQPPRAPEPADGRLPGCSHPHRRAAAADAAAPAASVPAAPSSPRPRVRPMGLLMAAILAATMLGLVYLTQTLGSNAANSEISQLEADGKELRGTVSTQVVCGSELDRHDSIAARARPSATSSSWATPSSFRHPDAAC